VRSLLCFSKRDVVDPNLFGKTKLTLYFWLEIVFRDPVFIGIDGKPFLCHYYALQYFYLQP